MKLHKSFCIVALQGYQVWQMQCKRDTECVGKAEHVGELKEIVQPQFTPATNDGHTPCKQLVLFLITRS
jgi:hypothetical protein